MKRLFVIVAIAAFTACGGNDSENESGSSAGDSMQRASDSLMQTGDTSAMNSAMGDSTSASGIHGEGSGSLEGGGETGAPQGNATGRKDSAD